MALRAAAAPALRQPASALALASPCGSAQRKAVSLRCGTGKAPVVRIGFTASSLFTSRSVVVSRPKGQAQERRTTVVVEAHKEYKMKTHKAAAKRFKVTGSGKIVRRHAWRQHLLRKKNSRRKNRLAGMTDVFRGDIDKIVGQLPYMKVNRRRLPSFPMYKDDGDDEEDDEEEA